MFQKNRGARLVAILALVVWLYWGLLYWYRLQSTGGWLKALAFFGVVLGTAVLPHLMLAEGEYRARKRSSSNTKNAAHDE